MEPGLVGQGDLHARQVVLHSGAASTEPGLVGRGDDAAAWLPRYVANELAGTHQAAAQHRQTAALRRAEANTDPEGAEDLRRQADDLDAPAVALDVRCADLQKIDDARAKALAHTAVTRANADAARYLLAERHADDRTPEPTVTAQEWLDADRAAQREDDLYRPTTETDLRSLDESQDDAAAAEIAPDGTPGVPPTDIRESAAAEPKPVAEDLVRVPTADDVDHSLDRAQQALDEMSARELDDAAESGHRGRAADFDDAADEDTDADIDADNPTMPQGAL